MLFICSLLAAGSARGLNLRTIAFHLRLSRAEPASEGHRQRVAHNFGLGFDAATTTTTFAPNNRSGGFVSDLTHADANHVREQIEIRRLDEVVPGLSLAARDFIKIDVEGFEGHVLRGARATLEGFTPVVVLELNHWCLNAFQPRCAFGGRKLCGDVSPHPGDALPEPPVRFR
ncbi:MAG: methyltransferase FkbM [Massilia sp.]|nr:methyltransferase FkbM [Massilia sp.]